MSRQRSEDGKAGGGAPETRNDPRKDRLAAALRENLKRRKAQARGKAAGPEPARDGGGDRED
jgi:hypothetical protein